LYEKKDGSIESGKNADTLNCRSHIWIRPAGAGVVPIEDSELLVPATTVMVSIGMEK